jgi:hypothetical protein
MDQSIEYGVHMSKLIDDVNKDLNSSSVEPAIDDLEDSSNEGKDADE